MQSEIADVQCPYCRVSMAKEDLQLVLQRPYECASRNGRSASANTIVDDLTRQWLQANTRQCGNCASYIEKMDGCDLMECLCGYRFCFRCGQQGGNCSCTPAHHVFWDNVQNRNSSRQHTPVVVQVERMNGGGAWINRRKEGEAVRTAREKMRVVNLAFEKALMDSPTLSKVVNGSGWLFQRNYTKNLTNLLEVREKTRKERKQNTIRRTMLDPDLPKHPYITPAQGTWLYETKHSEQMLNNLCQRTSRKMQRNLHKKSQRVEIYLAWDTTLAVGSLPSCVLGGKWFYEPHLGISMNLLKYHLRQEMKKIETIQRRKRIARKRVIQPP